MSRFLYPRLFVTSNLLIGNSLALQVRPSSKTLIRESFTSANSLCRSILLTKPLNLPHSRPYPELSSAQIER
ncbi:hypothetical protein B0H10DRAFT_2090251 [Mycena sp. CBHHK59/15]|nr:hypothetical protein B0H10DRAFT_2104919 [Mycena sp. CBHHK59/15]KAJ6595323.1 hypothetical protein B0H10DRAFT_2090251 [Mycena sp. CBHHK59/15]